MGLSRANSARQIYVMRFFIGTEIIHWQSPVDKTMLIINRTGRKYLLSWHAIHNRLVVSQRWISQEILYISYEFWSWFHVFRISDGGCIPSRRQRRLQRLAMVWLSLTIWMKSNLTLEFCLGCSSLTASSPYLLLWQGSSFYLTYPRLAIRGTWLRKWVWYLIQITCWSNRLNRLNHHEGGSLSTETNGTRRPRKPPALYEGKDQENILNVAHLLFDSFVHVCLILLRFCLSTGCDWHDSKILQ